jgi:uncharacterized protein
MKNSEKGLGNSDIGMVSVCGFDVQCSRMNIVQLKHLPQQPWRNGAGHTTELLAWPHTGDWQLRVSVATIAHNGAFSKFDAVQRWFAVIDGAGVSLDLPAGKRNQQAGDEPLHFDGAVAPMCHLLDGPTSDLNLMVKHGAGAGHMQVACAGDALAGLARWRGVYVADDAGIYIESANLRLQAGSLMWSDDVEPTPWQLRQAGRAWWLGLYIP